MVGISKISLVLLAGMLFYFSINANVGSFLPDNDHRTGQTRETQTLWFAEAPNLFPLTKPVKNLLKSLKNISFFNLSQYLNDQLEAWSFAQSKVTASDDNYISFSETRSIQPGIRTLIFPFHFFL
jgi:hypothetical protein